MNCFFTSDTHLGHTNIIKYCNRPFKDAYEMDETIIQNWNEVVRPNAMVFHLGDFCFSKDPDTYIKRLNGKIRLCRGNHDKWNIKQYAQLFESVNEMIDFKHLDIHIVLCHYALRVWNKSHFNSWHLYGHSHGGLPGQGKSFDVGVDCNGFRPLSFEEVKIRMEALPDNFNFLPPEKRR